MQLSPIGLSVNELDTPALLLDLEPFEHNVDKMAGHFRERSVQWRPHAKAFKCPAIAHILRRAGAIGVTVAKVSEAEVMAAGGINDILIAHLVVGPSKLARLAAFQKQADVKVTVDHPEHVAELSRAATGGRCHDRRTRRRRPGHEANRRSHRRRRRDACPASFSQPRLAIRRTDGLRGPYAHDRRSRRETRGHRVGDRQVVRDARLGRGRRPPCRIISAGGSGSYQYTADIAGITEIQAGGGIFACQYYTQNVPGRRATCPHLSVLATVVSRPARDRAILDIGQKSISQHQTPPVLRDYPDCRVTGLSAEHATIAVDSQNDLPIGEKVHVVPGYSDFTFVLHDRVLGFATGASKPYGTFWAAENCNKDQRTNDLLRFLRRTLRSRNRSRGLV